MENRPITRAPVELLAEWGVRGVVSVTLPETGSMNDTWLVKHEGGRNVFRLHRRTNRDAVKFEHSVLEWVRTRGVPVPDVLPTAPGERLLERDGGFFTVYSWAPGVQLERDAINSRQAEQMGATLARIHNALSTMPFVPISKPAEAKTDAVLDRIHVLCDVIRERADAADHQGALIHLWSRAKWLESSVLAAPADNAGPAQLVHGDYQHTNLFFDGDQVSSVIDWDKSRPEPPSLEVVRAMHYGLGVDPDRCAAFIDGYRRDREMPVETLLAAARIWGYHDAHNLWAFEQCYLRQDPRALRRFEPEPFVPFTTLWERASALLSPAE